MKTKVLDRNQTDARPNYLLGVYVLSVTLITLGFSVLTAIKSL